MIPIQYYVLPITKKLDNSSNNNNNNNNNNSSSGSSENLSGVATNCNPYPTYCDSTPLLLTRRSLECYGIRFCDAYIDIQHLEVLIWQASHGIRYNKRRGDKIRLKGNNNKQFYQKAYINPL